MSEQEMVRAHPANVHLACTGRRYSRIAWLRTPNWSRESDTTAVYRFFSANSQSSVSHFCAEALSDSVLLDGCIIHLNAEARAVWNRQVSIRHTQRLSNQHTAKRAPRRTEFHKFGSPLKRAQ